MTKNYFTDKQVEELVNKIGDTPLYNCEFVTLTPQELKALMNLAVEEAIGEPIGAINTESNSICRWHFHFSHEDYVHRFNPLYSVKELEN